MKIQFVIGVPLVLSLLSSTAMAKTHKLPAVDVVGTVEASANPWVSVISPEEHKGSSKADGAEFLAQTPGISAARMGGHGLEPIIRGQQQGQLNIIDNGSFIHGGCPNRMDPPSSFMSPDAYDKIIITKGYASVQNGSGGTGGTVRFEHEPIEFTGSDLQATGKASAGFKSNSKHRDGVIDIAAGNEKGQVRAIISKSKGGNYKDGNGNEVRSSFENESVNLMPVWNFSDNTRLKLGLKAARTENSLFAGAGMDSPDDRSQTYSLNFQHKPENSRWTKLEFEAYQSMVDHLMDNYTLRTNTGMKARTDSESDTLGGVLKGQVKLGSALVTIGTDMQNNSRDALRRSGTAAQATAGNAQSYLWPDAEINQTGLFVESEQPLGKARLKTGLRYDRVSAEARAANTAFGAKSANQLYTDHYGITASNKTEHNIGGLVRGEYDVSDRTTLFAGVSRSVRTADTTERFMAANHGVATNRWVGNPNLNPEKHHQLDAGVTMKSPSTNRRQWNVSMSAFYDDVSDFIMRDRARGQDGIVASSGETIYRNIDATLMGAEMSASFDITSHLTIDGSLAYTYGENDEDGDALAQIPPLEGHVAVSYDVDKWDVNTRVNFAANQSRIDDGTSNRDVGKTGGYATLDVGGGYRFTDAVQLRLGVDNVFDKNYAYHLNRSNAFDPVEVQVNEAGRTAWLRLKSSF